LRRWLYIFILLIIFVLFVLLYSLRFRPKEPAGTLPAPKAVENKLIIISPHWEGIRQEFTRAFQRWYYYRENRIFLFVDRGDGEYELQPPYDVKAPYHRRQY